MIKQLIAAVVFLAFGLVSSSAAEDAALTGKVASIDGNTVKIEVTGAMPVWAKKGGYLRATTADGKLVLRGAKITAVEGDSITVTTAKAKEMTVGGTYTLAKGKASAGC
jgi:protein-disulfide isomerase